MPYSGKKIRVFVFRSSVFGLRSSVFGLRSSVFDLRSLVFDLRSSFCRQRFPLLLGTNNAFKNLHGVFGNKERFSDKKFFNVIAYLQSEILIFLVFVSLGELTFFLGLHYQNFGQHDSGFGQHDFGRDDSQATCLVTSDCSSYTLQCCRKFHPQVFVAF